MEDRTLDRVRLTLTFVVTVAWLAAVATGRGVLVVTPPMMAIMAWAFRSSHRAPGAHGVGSVESVGSSQP